MRLLITADLQLGSGDGYGTELAPRAVDYMNTLGRITNLVNERGIDYLVIAGDVFQHRRPAVDELYTFGAWLETLECEVIIVAGNHDVRGPGLITTIELYSNRPNVTVFTTPDVMQLTATRLDAMLGNGPGVMLGVLPWAHPGHLRAAAAGIRLDRPDSDDREDLLLRIAKGLAEDVGADALVPPSGEAPIPVLVTHYALSGMSTPTGLPTSELNEAVLDCDELIRQGWAAVFAGHVHKREAHDEVDAWSIGSPWRHDFGEASIEPGVILFDTTGPAVDVIPTPDRDFVTLELEGVEDSADPDGRVAPLGPLADVAGAIVRVIVKVREDQVDRLDVESIRRNLAMRGAHKVHSIRLDVTRSRRARADVREDSEPLSALDGWAASTDLDAPATERLRALTEELLEGLR